MMKQISFSLLSCIQMIPLDNAVVFLWRVVLPTQAEVLPFVPLKSRQEVLPMLKLIFSETSVDQRIYIF